MEKLSVSEFVRYTLSAGIAFVAFALAYPVPARNTWHGITGTEGAVLGLTLLVAGAALYGFHRAILHPPLLRVILIMFKLTGRHIDGVMNPLKPTSVEIALIRARQPGKPLWSDLWAARTHSLYCSAWGIAAIKLWGQCFLGNPTHPGWLTGLFWAALGGALLRTFGSTTR